MVKVMCNDVYKVVIWVFLLGYFMKRVRSFNMANCSGSGSLALQNVNEKKRKRERDLIEVKSNLASTYFLISYCQELLLSQLVHIIQYQPVF